MWRWTKRTLIWLCGFVGAAALAGIAYQGMATRKDLAANPPPGRLVDIGSHQLHIWCTGAGAPAVILESGLGGSSFGWGFVQPEVARFTRVCSYDRAGMGYSDAGPSPRTTGRIVQELALLLDRAGISGPLVLVGASIGGFTVRHFASEHAERVAGLVLVDASHEDQEMELPRIAPLVVLTAGRGADPVWRELQRDLVGLSPRGCQVIAEQSGHAIALGQPQAVVEAIRATVSTARGQHDVELCG